MTQGQVETRSASAGGKRPRRIPLWLWPAGFAFLLAQYWNLTNPQDAYGRRPDAMIYDGIAANLAAGHGFSYDKRPPYRAEVTRPPFLPLLGAAVYTVFGHERHVFYFLNAVFIAAAVALGFRVAMTLFGDEKTAFVGAWIVALAPPVAGSANAVLTEPTAMLLVTASVLLLLRWHRDPGSGAGALWFAAGLAAVFAALILTRTNFTIHVLAASVWFVASVWRRRRQVGRWALVIGLFAAILGAPVLAWSARNASYGLAFTPMAAGKGPGYVHEIGRYAEHLLEPGQKLPPEEKAFWYHFRTPRSPQKMIALDRVCQKWAADWMSENWGRWLALVPVRLGELFSGKRISVYKSPFPDEWRATGWKAIRCLSATLWGLSWLGWLMIRRRGAAKWLFLILLGGLTVFSVATICQPRYLVPAMPVLLPFAAIPIVSGWRAFAQRRRG